MMRLLSKKELLGLKKILSTPALRSQVSDEELLATAGAMATMAVFCKDDVADLVAEISALL
jgi:hypothetical protein